MNILIVEDDYLIGQDLLDRLKTMGHDVLGPASNCAAALEALFNTRPDIAMVDTRLGSETCEAVLSECRALDVPVIICSAHDAEGLPAYCAGLPRVGKPFENDEIAGQVCGTLRDASSAA
ncbi:response regulator [Devosia sp.]|uniref:response regulator n=1 Tax=Devosia sp. TaxID=1871048 RepID=UPI003A9031BE